MSNRPTHVVLRIITGAEGGDIYGGTPEEPVLVDASEWPNAPFFEQSGHLRRATDEDLSLWESRTAAPADAEQPAHNPRKAAKRT